MYHAFKALATPRFYRPPHIVARSKAAWCAWCSRLCMSPAADPIAKGSGLPALRRARGFRIGARRDGLQPLQRVFRVPQRSGYQHPARSNRCSAGLDPKPRPTELGSGPLPSGPGADCDRLSLPMLAHMHPSLAVAALASKTLQEKRITLLESLSLATRRSPRQLGWVKPFRSGASSLWLDIQK